MALAVPQGRQGGIDDAVGVRKEGYVPQKLALTKLCYPLEALAKSVAAGGVDTGQEIPAQ